MGISREELFHVARLAHIDLTAAEAETLPAQLDRIVEYVKQLEALPMTGALGAGASAGGAGAGAAARAGGAGAGPRAEEDEASGAFTTPQTPLRADEPGACLSLDEALAAAPVRRGDLIAVPRVIGGEEEA